jgi:hypothetical protein
MTEVLLGAVITGAALGLLWFSRPVDGKMRPFLANELVEAGVAIAITLGIGFGVAKMVMGFV